MCAESDENFGYRFSKNQAELTSKFKKQKLGFRSSVFKNRLWQSGDGFSRCLIQNSSCSMIASTVKVFFFMPYLSTSSSESLRLIISCTNSARKYVISSVIHTKQHTVQKTEPKTETAVQIRSDIGLLRVDKRNSTIDSKTIHTIMLSKCQ